MPNPPNPKPEEQKPFAEFLREAPRHQGGAVTLTGHIAQSEKEGHFVLDLGGGQTVELPTDSVRNYKVVEEAGRLVQLEVKLEDSVQKSIFGETTTHKHHIPPHKHPTQDVHTGIADIIGTGIWDLLTIKEIILDPTIPVGNIPDPTQQLGHIGAAAIPFTLAAGHQAPHQALAFQGLSGQVKPLQDARTIAYLDFHTIKEAPKDPLYDTAKEVPYDTLKEPVKDPIYETVKEVFETLVEGGGTIAEGGGGGTLAEGGGFPGGFPGGGGGQF